MSGAATAAAVRQVASTISAVFLEQHLQILVDLLDDKPALNDKQVTKEFLESMGLDYLPAKVVRDKINCIAKHESSKTLACCGNNSGGM